MFRLLKSGRSRFLTPLEFCANTTTRLKNIGEKGVWGEAKAKAKPRKRI